MPAKHGVRRHQQSKPTESLLGKAMEQGSEESAVLGREPGAGSFELSLQQGELVPQRQDLHVFVPVAQRQQP
ncbi:hypothetical protein ABZ817_46745 [Streptomyces antimycoticus]|uniref:Uncharacterized protein n=1 Tax=Streptomyces antimycoticus TaxID=68175 RepID=A0ABD5JQP3_9ACTN|nr:hypothetical protein [Streptomyces violaceusniger]MEE4590076.1 hypothetical protein [Streptomyces sp. DSM 41602]